MKSIKLLLFFCLFSVVALGQNAFVIKGQLIDKKTKQPLPYANIVYAQKSLGTTSDIEGNFHLYLTEANKTDSIRIQYLGYETLNLDLNSAQKIDVYKLVPKPELLKEVKVREKKFNLRKFMERTITKYNEKRKATPHIAYGHFRECARYNGRYVMYMESLGYSIYSGEREDASCLSNYNFYCENLKCTTPHDDWIKIFKEGRGGQLINKYPVNGGSSNLNVFRCIERHGLLTIKFWKRYQFRLDTTYFAGQMPIFKISFKNGSEKGILHVCSENQHIIRVEQSTKQYWSNLFYKRIPANITFTIDYYNEIPFLSNITSVANYKGVEYLNTLHILSQKLNDFSLNWKEYWSMQDYAGNPYITYDPVEWSKYTIPFYSSYEKMRLDLESNGLTLEEQFKQASNKWYFPEARKSDTAVRIVNDLKKLF
ncbi:carboxypeptidase-like regulatory domain-containing protein [Puteibacter caeruleilacunae]|nr:carboxypeptidase-like regulatory domain-containing protein [Puteibacter caeruleilacunae]